MRDISRGPDRAKVAATDVTSTPAATDIAELSLSGLEAPRPSAQSSFVTVAKEHNRLNGETTIFVELVPKGLAA